MGTLTVNAINGQTVAAGASYVVPFPAGQSAGNYSTTGAKLTTGDGSVYPVTVSFGASGITVTNPTGRDIASGQFDFLDLQTSGILARFNSSGYTEVLIGPKNTEAGLVSATIDPVTGRIILSSAGIELPSAGPAFTYAGLPSAVALAGYTVLVTDIGAGSGSLFISNGSQWLPLNGQCNVARCTIPFILQSSGSVGDNGALTGITALDKTYTAAYLYFPVNAIFAGSVAGWYYAVMAGTTSGTVYNNVYTSGNPTVPAAPTPFVTTGPGAYIQTTAADIQALTVSVPANSLGLYGGLDYAISTITNNTVGTKTAKGFFGTTAFSIITATSNTFTSIIGGFSNAGLANKQYQNTQDFSLGLVGGATYAPTTGTVDSTTEQSARITLKLATATDYIILVRGSINMVGG